MRADIEATPKLQIEFDGYESQDFRSYITRHTGDMHGDNNDYFMLRMNHIGLAEDSSEVDEEDKEVDFAALLASRDNRNGSTKKQINERSFKMGSFRKTSQKQIFKKTEGELNVKKFKGLIEKKKLSLKTQTSLDLDKMDKLGEFSAEMQVKRSQFQEIWLKRIRSSFRPLSIIQKGKLSEKATLDFDATWVFAIEGKSFEQLDVSGIFEA